MELEEVHNNEKDTKIYIYGSMLQSISMRRYECIFEEPTSSLLPQSEFFISETPQNTLALYFFRRTWYHFQPYTDKDF